MHFSICELSKATVRHLIVKYHYSGRAPGIVHAWGLLEGQKIVGCIVYSVPASYTLCTGVCGAAYRKDVLELSRLVITTKRKNAASFLIGNSLRLLGKQRSAIVVSYADCNDHIGHVGYVYQATNWLYTGHGNAEPKWVETSTGKVVAYTRRHIDAKARELGYDWELNSSKGPGLHKEPMKGKHRYVTFVGDKRFCRKARSDLRYKVLGYPKGPTQRHAETVLVVMERKKPAP